MKPILITENTAMICLQVKGRCYRSIDTLTPEIINLLIQRAGCCEGYLLAYPALSVEDNKVCFRLDDEIHELEEGRYICKVTINDVECQSIQIQIGEPCFIQDVETIEFTNQECS
jgi:hypothetical protein